MQSSTTGTDVVKHGENSGVPIQEKANSYLKNILFLTLIFFY